MMSSVWGRNMVNNICWVRTEEWRSRCPEFGEEGPSEGESLRMIRDGGFVRRTNPPSRIIRINVPRTRTKALSQRNADGFFAAFSTQLWARTHQHVAHDDVAVFCSFSLFRGDV